MASAFQLIRPIGRAGLGMLLSIFDTLKRFGFMKLISIMIVFSVFIPTIHLAIETKNPSYVLGDMAFRLVANEHTAIESINYLKANPGVGLWEWFMLVSTSILGSFILLMWLVRGVNRLTVLMFGQTVEGTFGRYAYSLMFIGLLEFAFLAASTGDIFSSDNIPFMGLAYFVINIGVVFAPVIGVVLNHAPQTSAVEVLQNESMNISGIEKERGLFGALRELIF